VNEHYYTKLAAPIDVIPGMVVRVTKSADAVLACADRLEDCRGVYGMVLSGYEGSGQGAISIVPQGTISLQEHQWANVLPGPLVPGEVYYLSDQAPGHLSTTPGNFVVQVGIAHSNKQLHLGIQQPTLRLHGRIVESAWLREDRRAFALVFADTEQQVWEVRGDDGNNEHGQILDIFERRQLESRKHVRASLPQGSLRGAFGDLCPDFHDTSNRFVAREAMEVGGTYAIIELSANAFLAARDALNRAMRADEKWTEV